MSQKRTPSEAKAWLKSQGYSVSGWARANNFSIANTRQVLNGKSKLLYGESRRIAKALAIPLPNNEEKRPSK